MSRPPHSNHYTFPSAYSPAEHSSTTSQDFNAQDVLQSSVAPLDHLEDTHSGLTPATGLLNTEPLIIHQNPSDKSQLGNMDQNMHYNDTNGQWQPVWDAYGTAPMPDLTGINGGWVNPDPWQTPLHQYQDDYPIEQDPLAPNDCGVLDLSFDETFGGQGSNIDLNSMYVQQDLNYQDFPLPTELPAVPDPHVPCNIPQPSHRAPKPRTHISTETKAVLENYFAHEPYPSPSRVNALADDLGLPHKSVKTWFNNHRARCPQAAKLQTPITPVAPRSAPATFAEPAFLDTSFMPSSMPPAVTSNGTGLTKERLASVSSSSSGSSRRSVTMDRFLNITPAEDEPNFVPGPLRLQTDCPSLTHSASYSNSNHLQFENNTPASVCSTDSYAESRATSTSFSSAPRRGRRRFGAARHEPYPSYQSLRSARSNDTPDTPASGNGVYVCTFCHKRYRNKYEWKRHEESVHVPNKLYICLCGVNDKFADPCTFCGDRWPSAVHDCYNNYQQCLDKPEQERTFTRKDHLLQHIRQVHQEDPANIKDTVDHWCKPAPPPALGSETLRCGFCQRDCPTWKDRVDHVAQHFQDGLDISQWNIRPNERPTSAPQASIEHLSPLNPVDDASFNLQEVMFAQPSPSSWPENFATSQDFTTRMVLRNFDADSRRPSCRTESTITEETWAERGRERLRKVRNSLVGSLKRNRDFNP